MRKIELDLMVQTPQWGNKQDWLKLFQPAAEAVSHRLPETPTPLHISVLLADDAQIAFHNRQWRGKQGPTNVLSFPSSQIMRDKGFLGDIIMSIETLQVEAQNQHKPVHQHALHLFVHGLLHLLGYGHEKEPDAQVMEGLEKKILLELGQPDPYE
jgi:probable rRNA maturation factor